jgi:hypothetical protein
MAWLEVIREGHALAQTLGLAQGLEFLAALGNQLVVILGRGGGVWVRHGRSPAKANGRVSREGRYRRNPTF